MKILFLIPYPLKQAPSQRFRFEQYLDHLSKNGYEYKISSFLTSSNWEVLFKSGRLFTKGMILLKGFASRFITLFHVPSFDYIFIHREAAPIGPPIIEWVIAKILKKKIIYDFDDAIWLTDKVQESKIERLIRWRSKVPLICKWSFKVSCGNEYLCAYASQFNIHSIVNPTTIDTTHLHNPDRLRKNSSNKIIIGWTGSHSTLKYLNQVTPIISMLEKKHQLIFLVIANQKPDLQLESLQFVTWNELSEAQDLFQIDIGIMPLPDDEWAKGKCGFKILQYMALRIPALASPVGVNTKIITNEVNGFLCNDDNEWYSQLERLILDSSFRIQLGSAGRSEVEKNYSVDSNSSKFLSLFA